MITGGEKTCRPEIPDPSCDLLSNDPPPRALAGGRARSIALLNRNFEPSEARWHDYREHQLLHHRRQSPSNTFPASCTIIVVPQHTSTMADLHRRPPPHGSAHHGTVQVFHRFRALGLNEHVGVVEFGIQLRGCRPRAGRARRAGIRTSRSTASRSASSIEPWPGPRRRGWWAADLERGVGCAPESTNVSNRQVRRQPVGIAPSSGIRLLKAVGAAQVDNGIVGRSSNTRSASSRVPHRASSDSRSPSDAGSARPRTPSHRARLAGVSIRRGARPRRAAPPCQGSG